MLQTLTLLQPLSQCHDKALTGGKAVNLGLLLRANFPVPDGFCITTDAYRYWTSTGREDIPSDLTDEILRAYRAMGSPPVAVRSSATAEDLAEASMAGQYDTFLDVRDEDALLTRIRLCWASLDSPRTRAYLQQHGIDLARVAMAVVVQRLVPADVAGVLFTANPQTGSKSEMLVEASWGLGEAVVSGLVQPDILRIDKQTGRVTHATIADKQVYIPPTGLLTSVSKSSDNHEAPVPDDKRRIPCLKGNDVSALWKLGLLASQHFNGPQDIEWALHAGKLYLLQSRPITTLEDAEAYEHLLTSTRSRLREALANDHGPWVIHNLAETLPHPTPLTWSVIRRFMSGDGGFGRMYRQAGFEPSPTVCRDGFLTPIAGKVYMDARLAPEMFFENFPFQYDVNELRKNPDAAQNPPTIPSGPMTARLKMARRAAAATHTVQQLAIDYDQKLTNDIIPAFTAWVAQEKSKDLTTLTTDQLIALWHAREHRVMDDFAPASLLPSLISAAALADLKSFLEETFWDDDPDALTHLLSSAHDPDTTVRANIALYELSHREGEAPSEPPPSPVGATKSSPRREPWVPTDPQGASPGGATESSAPIATWLSQFGHRAPEEFDLSIPRWRERPQDVLQLAHRLRDGKNPADLHAAHQHHATTKLSELRARLSPADQKLLDEKLTLARRYMPFREDGKHHLMRGYDLLRDLALEMGRRLEIHDDIFLLTLEEAFDALNIGFPPTHLLAQRKIARRAEARIPLPHVIDATNVDTLGTPPQSAIGNPQSAILDAFPISPGSATAPARIVKNPTDPVDLPDRYILVCPSTDPSWTPLFTNAAGLILERGGTLSHGAVVAREMSIPAVVLRDATTLLHDDDEITIDGRHGTVSRTTPTPGGVASATPSAATTPASSRVPLNPLDYDTRNRSSSDPTDTRIPRSLIPPPLGRKERQSATLRNYFLLAWSLYLLATFLLPDSILYQPSLRALDLLLWPLVRLLGKPVTVALIAASLAALTMLGQKYLTDNERLRAAKLRAAALTKQANELPPDSPRAQALRRLAAPVQTRTLLASFVPLALLLGPMVMTFLWIPARLTPEAWNAPPGTSITVVAMVKPDAVKTVTLDAPAGLTLSQPPTQPVPDIRRVLEKYRDTTLKPSDLSNQPWEIRQQAESFRQQTFADLNDYLQHLPPVPVTWTLTSPENTPGHWPITLRADNSKSLSATLVLGDTHPPTPTEITNTPNHPLTTLKLAYLNKPQNQPFFTLFHRDIGWLGLYLLAYLPLMFALRAALKIA